MKPDRKALTRAYRETPSPMGVYRLRNTVAAVSLLGTSVNLPAMFNRVRFQLEMGSHPNRALQADWNQLGPEAFEFEVLDRLEPPEVGSAYDPAPELAALEGLWAEKLLAAGERLYGPMRTL